MNRHAHLGGAFDMAVFGICQFFQNDSKIMALNLICNFLMHKSYTVMGSSRAFSGRICHFFERDVRKVDFKVSSFF